MISTKCYIPHCIAARQAAGDKLKKFILFTSILFSIPALSQTADSKRFIFYTDTGHGKPLVLIHAFPFDHHLWDPQRAGLSKNFRVITLDLWGLGTTETPHKDGVAITMNDYADEVKEVLDNLHIKKAIIGGESMGGYVSLAFLKNYPDRVSGLILSDTQSIADTDEQRNKREAAAVDILEHGADNFIQSFLPKTLSSHAPAQLRFYVRKMMYEQPCYSLASALRGMGVRDDHTPVLTETSLPILILSGDEDVVISPEQSEKMHKIAKNSQYVVIKKSGHLANLEQSAQWNSAVLQMFR